MTLTTKRLRVVRSLLDDQALVLTDGSALTLWTQSNAGTLKARGKTYRFAGHVRASSL
jgi:hypothetical protein